MIRIDVEEYCQSCLDFTPDVIKPQRTSMDIYTDTVVQCEYKKRCAGIERHLRQLMRSETETEAVG